MSVPDMKGQVHILYRNSLLARGLEKLMAAAGVHLHKIEQKGPDPLDILPGSVQPGDTVLMERQGGDDLFWGQVLRLLSNLPAVTLIVIDPSSSRVQVFRQQQCAISSPEELATIIGGWGEWGHRIGKGQQE